MPDDKAAADQQASKVLEQLVNDHPAFASPANQGGRTNDYAPVNIPNDPTAHAYYAAHVPEGSQPATTPQQAAPEPAQPSAPAPAAQPASQPGGDLIFGKYKSQDEAQRGYWELVDKLKEMNVRNTALEAANLHLQTTLQPQRQERQAPPQPQYIPVQFQGDQPVVPVDSLRGTTQEDAARVARETVQSILAPIQQFNAVQTRIASEFPDFPQRQAEFAQWLSRNPEYQERVGRDPDHLESAWLRYDRESAQRAQSGRAQVTQQAQAQVSQARQQASASTQGSNGRRMDDAQSRAAMIGKALEYAQRTGDWKPYKDLRMSEALGEDFLNSLALTNWGR